MTPGRTNTMRFFLLMILSSTLAVAQPVAIKWAKDGNAYYRIESNEVFRYDLPANTKTSFITQADLTPAGQAKALSPRVSNRHTRLVFV